MTADATDRPSGFVPGRHALDSYGRGGFRFGGMSHRGSLLILPSGIQAWAVESAGAITSATLAPAWAERDGIEFLLVGTGPDLAPVPERVRAPFREAGISVDAMATGAAARTYNVLLAEGRRVAAALVAVD